MAQEQTTGAGLTKELVALRQENEHLKLMSARMEQAEKEYARFFGQSLELLCVAGLDGYFKRMNPPWATQLGRSLEELAVRPFLDFIHPDDQQATLAQMDALSKGSETILFENRYRHKNGSYRWLRWNARLVPESQRIFASARDVTGQKRLEREILEIADQEKDRLGRELHDGMCQTLAGIAALSSTLAIRLDRDSDSAASADAREISILLNEAIVETRNLAHSLGPLALHAVGLEALLQTLALNINDRFSVSCTLACDWPIGRLHHDAEAHLYRIAQEAVNNAMVHGCAQRIEISLGIKGEKGLLCIRDDGVGVSEEAGAADGVGMHTMAYRSRIIGGSLAVRRRSLRGTVVSCVFPIPGTHHRDEDPDHEHDDS